ncbi:MAG: hypothetical protein V8T87_06525 [Victivallales bacterium]
MSIFMLTLYRKPVPFVVQFPSVEELLKRYDECGIEMGCVLPVVNSEIYLPQANEDILEMAEQHPDRIIPFCNVDPRALSDSPYAPLDRVLAYYKDKGCRGVGEIMPNLATMDERVQNLFRCAEKVGLPVTWDGSDRIGGDFGLYDEPGIPQFERTLARFPKLTVFAHGPIFWSELGDLRLRHSGNRFSTTMRIMYFPKCRFRRSVKKAWSRSCSGIIRISSENFPTPSAC